ncbi:MAG: shikimate kinase [Bacteroidaceae bacterium]|nr:shikimate kinase [Bacteroidaceae bacterium]
MKSIILIGYMGAGKTTIGKLLASKLNCEFYDLDWYIESRFHKSIPDIFAERGEDGFRQIERSMLQEVVGFEDAVIAVGGGTPCFFDNMEVMNTHAQTIYLKASVSTLIDHLHMSHTTRPLLEGKSDDELKVYIEENLNKREKYYLQANHILHIDTIHTEAQIEDYVEEVKRLLKL